MRRSRPDVRPPHSAPSPWGRLLSLLVFVVLVLGVLAAVILVQRRQPSAPQTSTSTAAPLADTTQTSTAATGEASESRTSSEPTVSASVDPLDPTAVEVIDPAAAREIPLPEAFRSHGYDLLHILPDGRLVLLNPTRLSLLDPQTGEETEVARAEFGLQAAANDRWLVYGEGGDEVFAIHSYEIATGEQRERLRDEVGFYGLELGADDRFHTTALRSQPGTKLPDAWLSVSLHDDMEQRMEPTLRRLGDHALAALWPDLELSWAYRDGASWYRSALDLDGRLHALQVTVLDRRAEFYEWQLFAVEGEGAEASLVPRSPRINGTEPQLVTRRGLLIIDRVLAYLPEEGRWLRLQLPAHLDARRGPRFVGRRADGSLYVGTGDDNGLATGLGVIDRR